MGLKAYVTFVAVLAVTVSKVNTLSDSGLTTMAVGTAMVSAGNAALVVPRNVIATVLPARACAWTSFGAESPESHLRAQAVVAALLLLRFSEQRGRHYLQKPSQYPPPS